MSGSSMVAARRLAIAFSLLGLSGCGNVQVSSTSGGGGTGGGPCQDYCDAIFACGANDNCKLSAEDPAAACGTACAAGLDKLGAADAASVGECLACTAEFFQESCQFDAQKYTEKCDAACISGSTQAALEKWLEASSSELTCESGRPFFGSSCEYDDSSGTGCQFTCCATGDCSASPDVAVTCADSPNGLSCTCSAGKSTGAPFSGGKCDPNELLSLEYIDSIWAACSQ